MPGALPSIEAVGRKLAAFQLSLFGRKDAPARLALAYAHMAEWDLDLAREGGNTAPVALSRAHQHLALASTAVGNPA